MNIKTEGEKSQGASNHRAWFGAVHQTGRVVEIIQTGGENINDGYIKKRWGNRLKQMLEWEHRAGKHSYSLLWVGLLRAEKQYFLC